MGTRRPQGPELRFALENIVGSFEIAILACSAAPYALAWSRWCLRQCLQGTSEPQVRSKGLLGLAPELPDAHKSCSDLFRSRLCTEKAAWAGPKATRSLESAARNRCSKGLFGNHSSNVLLEITVRSHMSLQHCAAHPLPAVLLAKCMECTGSH